MDPVKVASALAKKLSDHRSKQEPGKVNANPPQAQVDHDMDADDLNQHQSSLEDAGSEICPHCHQAMRQKLVSKASGTSHSVGQKA